MQVCGRYFSKELIERIQATVDSEPEMSRRELSRRVCEWLQWRGANGKLQDVSCRKALLKLHRRGVISLPECSKSYSFQHRKAETDEPLVEMGEVCCSLQELGGVEIEPVSSRYSKSSRIWKVLMKRFHYLGDGPLCGEQIRYLVYSRRYGYIGALSFSAATWRLKARDRWIGWSEAARRANLQKVICNSRFLIVPWVQVNNLASHILGQALRRLAKDWKERYGYEAVLVETFVDGRRFRGTSYRAANWKYVGQSAARPTAYGNGKIPNSKKDIYAYPLRADWQAVLSSEPERPLGGKPRHENPVDWAEVEFGNVELYDPRLQKRLYSLADDFFARPGALVPQACNGSKAKTKAAYRFFDNQEVSLERLLASHKEATLERIKAERVVLAVQDTTVLTYTAHAGMEGIGPINTTENKAVGLLMHDTMAFTVDGVPLGLVDVQVWSRDEKQIGKKYKELPRERKESQKWFRSLEATSEMQRLSPQTMLVSVGDREADIYELFVHAQESGVKLLVRAERTRNRQVEDEHLWERMARQPIAGYQEVYIPRKGTRAARTAKLAVRYAQVSLRPPRGKDFPTLSVWVVYVQEVDCPLGDGAGLEWMLLTTVETTTFEEACERIVWYTRRWGIEVYHRTLKSGCRIEDRRLGSADRLEACLAIDMVVAWRIYLLTKQGRETPDVPCDVFLTEEEWQALCAYVTNKPPPAHPPPLREAVRMIASLGGFLGRKGDAEPGVTTMWRGLQRLADITLGYSLGKSLSIARPP